MDVARDWIGGIVSLPSYVTAEGEPYRPELLIWASLDGMVRGVHVFKPGEALAAAPFQLKRAIGDGAPPLHLRVATRELAAALAPAFRNLTIECAPTPEMDVLLESFAEYSDRTSGEQAPRSYLECGVSETDLASFFRAAKRFYDSAPWGAFGGPCVVDIPELGVKDAAFSIMSDGGQHHGFLLFASLDDLDRFAMGGVALDEGKDPDLPAHTALEFEPKKRVAASMRAEVERHRWPIPRGKYPIVYVVDDDYCSRGPAPRELAVLEAICGAVADALMLEPSETSSHRVTTSAGPVNVDLRWVPSELDELPESKWIDLFCQVLQDRYATTPERMTQEQFDEILFNFIPAHVVCEPDMAQTIVEDVGALLIHAGREDILEQFNAAMVEDLEEVLSDPSLFGPLKRIAMAAVREQAQPSRAEKKKKKKAERKARWKSR